MANNHSRTAAVASSVTAGAASLAKYGGTPGKIAAGGVLAGAGIYYGSKAAFGQTPGEMISKRSMPSALDALQAGSSFAAEASLVASAQMAREIRKSVTVKEIKATLTKAKIEGRSKLGRKADMLAALDKAGVKKVGKMTIGKAYGTAHPYLLATSSLMTASNTYNIARERGSSKMEAAAAAAVSATPTALAVAAPSVLGRVAPAVAANLVKFSPHLMLASMAVSAIKGGYKAYSEGKGGAEIAGRAGLGLADAMLFGYATTAFEYAMKRTHTAPVLPSQPQLPPPNPSANTTTAAGGDTTAVRLAQAAGQMNDAGLPASGRSQMIEDPAFLRREGDPRMGPREKRATQTMSDAAVAQGSVRYQRELIKGEQRGDPAASALMTGIREQRKAPTGGSGSVGRQSSLDSGQQRAFAEANTHFAASHMDNPASEGTGPTGVGWGNPATQAAAQEKRGVKNKTPWAKA